MKAIMVMYDSLNRHCLAPYNSDWTHTPHFSRLAEKCVVFDKSYVGSLPCMPARRELHTGRHNFLHRSWGPLEPFDDSCFEIMKKNGVHSHLISDHYHYWEDGGCTYHNRYASWEIVRGQEGDRWEPDLIKRELPPHLGQMMSQDLANREKILQQDKFPIEKTFDLGLEFIEKYHTEDNWFLQIETFDPHEPFFHRRQKEKAAGPLFDWPNYAQVSDEERPWVDNLRQEYSGLLDMCDAGLGRVLDMMDKYDLWQDTLLIVNTDHGYLLSEHDWWAKANDANFYEEVSHTPLFIYDPRSKKTGRNRQLVQTIDLAPTLLDFFDQAIPPDMQGKPLGETIAHDTPVRKTALFGVYGAQVSCTDGTWVYTHAPTRENRPLNHYTLMPTHMRHPFTPQELQHTEMVESFSFTKGCRLMKIADIGLGMVPLTHHWQSMLFNVTDDPRQTTPQQNPEVIARLKREIVRLMAENDAPSEQYERLGLEKPNVEEAM